MSFLFALQVHGLSATVFPLVQCGRKNNYFGHSGLRIRGNKLQPPNCYRAALIIRRNIYITHSKLEGERSSHTFVIFLTFFFFRFLVSFSFLFLTLYLPFSSYFCTSSNVFSFIWRNSFMFNKVNQNSTGNSNPPCFKSTEYLLSPVYVMCNLPPFFRKKDASFVKNFETCPTVFPLFITSMPYLSFARAPFLVLRAVVNLAPISGFH